MKALKCFLVTVSFALLVNSCNNPFNAADTPEAGSLPAGKGSFSLKIDGPSGRTIMPEAVEFEKEDLFYELIFTPTGADGSEKTAERTYSELAEPETLDVGTYRLEVNVYADENYDQLLFSGTSALITIEEGKTTLVEITLQPVLEGGEGTFSWDITLPDDVLSAVMEITKKDGGTLVERITLYDKAANADATEGARKLDSGFYDVIIEITGKNLGYEEPLTVTRKEILHIYKGRESKYKSDFANIDFNIVYTVTFQLGGYNHTDKFVHGSGVSAGYFNDDILKNLPDDAYLCLGNPDSVPSYTVEGLYSIEDGTTEVDWDMQDDVFIGDITLYARLGGPIDVSKSAGDTNFEKIVNFINSITTTNNTSYTLFIKAGEVNLTKSLTINNGVTLTVTSADVNTPSTINRDFEDTEAESGLFIVGNGANLTFENIAIDGQQDKPEFAGNTASLVRVNAGGTLTMKDGAVLRNNQAQSGGGVNVNSGIFTMSGGEIINNTAISSGGGVIVVATLSSSTPYFTMEGSAEVSDNTADSGGGVSLNGSHPSFTMKGNAKVSRNTATGTGSGGGGVTANGTFIMEGNAEVSYNKATTSSGYGGVYFGGTTLKLGGNAKIKGNYKGSDPADNNNVYLSGNKYITLGTDDNAPQNEMEIWVTTAPSNSGVIVNTGAESGDERYFHADDEANSFIIFDNGKLVLKTVTAGLDYEAIGTTAYRVKKPTAGTLSGELVIPSHYEEKPVTAIGAFDGTGITAVYIPATVTSIGNSAFYNCSGLTSITIPANVETIGTSAFSNCGGLTTVTFEAGSNLTTINYGVFTSTGLTSITIPAGVTSVGGQAFAYCPSLTSITIPVGVSVGGQAFVSWGVTQTIYIEGQTTGWDENWRFDCSAQIYYLYSTEGLEFQSEMGPTGPTHYIAHKGSVTDGAVVIPSHYRFPDSNGPYLPVMEIGDSAFSGCTGITAVHIPETVTNIGSSAFSGCTSLTGITLPASVGYIGSSAFSGCTGIDSLTLPATIVAVNGSAFSGWASTQKIYIEGETTGWASDWQDGCDATVYSLYSTPGLDFTLIDGNTAYSVSKGTATDGTGAIQIHIPPYHRESANDSYLPVTEIGGIFGGISIYNDNTNITAVYIPATVTSMATFAFNYCSNLTTIIISAGVPSIGEFAFTGCTSLTSISIPASVTEIGENAFDSCTGLTNVTFAEGSMLETIGAEAFAWDWQLASITIPEGVTTIGDGAFLGCTSFTSINIPASVTTIGKDAFKGESGLNNLTNVTFAEGSHLESIGESAFSLCSFTSITFPASVTTIGDYLFDECSNLTTVTCLATTPPTLSGLNMFLNIDDPVAIEVPAGSVDAYQAAPYWSNYASQITAIE